MRKFTSYSKDAESAGGLLNYALFRQHSARIGRFLTADPEQPAAHAPQALNRYSYVAGDPINRIDPRGLLVWPTHLFGFCDTGTNFWGAHFWGGSDPGGSLFNSMGVFIGDSSLPSDLCDPTAGGFWFPPPDPCEVPLYRASCSVSADGSHATLACGWGGPGTCCNPTIKSSSYFGGGYKYSCVNNCVKWRAGGETFTTCCCAKNEVDNNCDKILGPRTCGGKIPF
jgi:RHS repeat-associated protein